MEVGIIDRHSGVSHEHFLGYFGGNGARTESTASRIEPAECSMSARVSSLCAQPCHTGRRVCPSKMSTERVPSRYWRTSTSLPQYGAPHQYEYRPNHGP